jgi:hypothetical protein
MAGRPKKDIDSEQVLELAKLHCTIEEMSAVFNCDRKTLYNRFHDVIERGKEQGKMSLRRKQVEMALSGNVPMLIWLGKNYLGQTDKQEIEHSGGITVELVKYADKNPT